MSRCLRQAEAFDGESGEVIGPVQCILPRHTGPTHVAALVAIIEHTLPGVKSKDVDKVFIFCHERAIGVWTSMERVPWPRLWTRESGERTSS